jgi:uncharacterized membrane protein YgdD (TMEM256/DUF423 family)
MNRAAAIGALCCAAAVAAGAFGAHGLEERLAEQQLEWWDLAARYLLYSGLGQIVAALVAERRPAGLVQWASPILFLGGVIFSGTLATMALGGPRWLGAITPIGGLGLILGFLALAWGAWRIPEA